MSESIVVALISSGITGFVSVITIVLTNRKSTSLLTYRMGQLEQEVRKHNGFDSRIHCVEKDIDVLKVKQETTNARLKKLGG